jgi:hypothetical protein
MTTSARDTTWLGPYVIDGEPLLIRRNAPNSAPTNLFRPNGRLWELVTADTVEPSRPRVNGLVARSVLDNDASDAEGVRALIGPGRPVVFLAGWGDMGPSST